MVSADPESRAMKERWRLTVFLTTVLALAALINQLVPAAPGFNAKPIAQLRQKQPDVVFIGDSILIDAIDPRFFEERAGSVRRLELVAHDGTASAAWYLVLKNYVIASGVRPRLCCIFFRDRLLTNATFRTTPAFRRYLDSVMPDDDPVFRSVLAAGSDQENSVPQRAIRWLFPLNERRHVQQERISRFAFNVAALGGRGVGSLRQRVNETFDLASLPDEIPSESAAVSAQSEEPFDPDPQRNFLPHIVEIAAQAGIPLCFVREKRHPLPDGRVPQNEALTRYIADLRAWLQSRGCSFVDLTDDPGLTGGMYEKEGDDHIRPAAKRRATEIYAERLRPFLH
jgi:hypothetical protein